MKIHSMVLQLLQADRLADMEKFMDNNMNEHLHIVYFKVIQWEIILQTTKNPRKQN
jgi:hypothetical protein